MGRLAIIFVAAAFLPTHMARAQDLTLYLKEVSRVGPSQFVDWAAQYYAERENGKSGFQGSESQVGGVAGAIMGAGVGMLDDDMFSGMKEGFDEGKDTGGTVGNAYGAVEGNSEQLEDVITNYINDRDQVLQQVQSTVQSCMQGGKAFSDCRNEPQLTPLIGQIEQINFQYCQQAVEVPSPVNASKTMLSPDLCTSQ